MSQLTHRFRWRGIAIRVVEIRNHRIAGWTRLELDVHDAEHRPIPITEAGTLVHEIDADQLKEAGGVPAFFIAWCEREAGSQRYARAIARWRQLSLF